jgi:hypothetical protein
MCDEGCSRSGIAAVLTSAASKHDMQLNVVLTNLSHPLCADLWVHLLACWLAGCCVPLQWC